MWMFLQYLQDMWSKAVPFVYAVLIVTGMIIILGMAL
tara:strand:+ start:511 stop:621 length:111 start_codon:yes stop_codon:yes gene_type:complete